MTIASTADTLTFAVNDIFPTIQGEGVLAGTPAVFLRLQGCAVHCHFCDTKETWEIDPKNETTPDSLVDFLGKGPLWARMTVEQIIAQIERVRDGIRWVVLTGGEPAEQKGLHILVAALHVAGLKVAIETSGTALGHVGAAFDHVCVSPKLDNPGGRPFITLALRDASEVKWVVGKEADIDRLRRFLANHAGILPPDCTIAVQPLSMQQRATDICLRAAMQYGWRVSIQTHKYLDLP